MVKRGRGDLRVGCRPWSASPVAGAHELTPAHRDRLIERQDATSELPRQELIHPGFQSTPLRTRRQALDAADDLAKRNVRKEQVRRPPASQPPGHARRRNRAHHLADDVGVEQKPPIAHRSTGRPDEPSLSKLKSSPTKGELRKNASSSSPVCAG